LEALADASYEDIRSFSWLLRAERDLYDLRPKLVDHLSACAAEWSEVVEAEAPNRPHLVTWLERQFRRRVDHLTVLDHLFTEIRAAGLDSQTDLTSLAAQLKDWIHHERQLHTSDNDYVFRLYWDDLGGEA
jgi:hypothetical protein